MIGKANASKLKQADYVYILEPKADHQGSKTLWTDFRWIGLYIIEKVLPKTIYLVRKIGTNITQILHQMRLRQFTPRQLIPDTPITPREWQPDPEFIIKHDGLYARAWECEYDEPLLDSDYNNLATPISPEVTIRSAEAADEMRSTPGTIRENSPEITPQPDRSYDGTDMDHYMQPDADTSVEQLDPTPTNPRSSNYDLRLNPKPSCSDDYRYRLCPTTVYATHTYTFGKSYERVMELICGKPTYFFKRLAIFPKKTIQLYRSIHTNFSICRYWDLDLHHIALISSNDIRSVFGTTPVNQPNFDSGYNAEYQQIFLVFCR